MQCILTLDIGVPETLFCVLDINLNVISKGSYNTGNMDGESLVKQIVDFINLFQNDKNNFSIKDIEINCDELDLIAVGISTGGIINHSNGLIKHANGLLKDLTGLNIKKSLKDINLPVFIENNVNCAMLYELDFGKIKLNNNAMLISINNGVGSSLVFDGKLFKGTEEFAGEIGYMNMYNSTVEEVLTSHNIVSDEFYKDLVYLLTNLYYVNATDIFLLKGKLIESDDFDIEKLKYLYKNQINKPFLEKVEISKVSNSKYNSCYGIGSLVLDHMDNMSARYVK